MYNKIKFCLITSTRADYGVMYWLIKKLKNHKAFDLDIVATGTHLSEKYGNTVTEIINDGFEIAKKIDLSIKDDSPKQISNGLAKLTIGLADFFNASSPDAIIILGDRYELLPIGTTSTLFKIPIIHFNGGELTSGAIDDQIRHSITKLSHIHFTSTEEFKKRVIKLGESPERVFNIGTLGSENFKSLDLLSKEELENDLKIDLNLPSILITFHPETQREDYGIPLFKNLIKVLRTLDNCNLIFTYPNADPGNEEIILLINRFVSDCKNAICVKNLGQIRYLSTLQFVKAIVGNSSSGIVEAPSFNIHTINMGNRQEGRLMAESIIQSKGEVEELTKSIKKVLSETLENITNPYQKYEYPSDKVIELLEQINFKKIFYKKFYEQNK